MVSDSVANKEKSFIWKIMEVIAFLLYLPLGILASIVTVLQILFLCITVIGIPVAIVLAKSLSTYFNPVGKILKTINQIIL